MKLVKKGNIDYNGNYGKYAKRLNNASTLSLGRF